MSSSNAPSLQTADPHRPLSHFMPPANWMNDPNGPIFWKGRHHLFYQHNPKEAWFSGPMCWGHAVSDDLVNWTHLPIALAPTPGGPDKDGCWTGSAVDNNGVPTIMYTGVHPEVQCVATGGDDLVKWQKHPANPVIAQPPPGLDVTGFRDPCVWREDDAWYVVIGSGIKGEGGAALFYRSPDLISWEYLHPLLVGQKESTGEMWECPDFFPLGDKHVLLVSVLGTTLYFIGTYRNHRFYPEIQGNTDFGGSFYAAKSYLDGSGRRILWGWIWEGRNENAVRAAGWAGVMSFPRILGIDGSVLTMEPAPELLALRGASEKFEDFAVAPGEMLLDRISGDSLEISAEIDPGSAEEVGLKVFCAPDGSEETIIAFNQAEGRIWVNRERSSLSPDVHRSVNGGPFKLNEGENLNLRVFLDKSVVEVFANRRACLTTRVYPSRRDSVHVKLTASGGTARVSRLEAWKLLPARIE